MKIFLIFLMSFIVSKNLYGQETYLVTYDILYNTERPVKKIGELLFDSQNRRSIFIESNVSKERKTTTIKSSEWGNEIEMNMVPGDNNPQFNYIDFSKDTLISAVMIFDTYNIAESLPVMEWKITDRRKKIGKHDVILAETIFRGRKYMAWFSEAYPINIGPWKLHGLPGLILEAYDESKRYKWMAKGIKLNQRLEDYAAYFNLIQNNNKTIDIKTYVQKRYDISLGPMIKARLPRDVKIKNKVISNRNGLEILFEWEIQN